MGRHTETCRVTKYESDMDAAQLREREERERAQMEQAEEMTAYPPCVVQFLKRPGALCHGMFKVVGNPGQAEESHRAVLSVGRDRLTTTFTVGATYSPDREDWICSEPWEYQIGNAYRNIPGTSYPMERAS